MPPRPGAWAIRRKKRVGKVLILNAFGGTNVTIVGVVADIKQDGPKNRRRRHDLHATGGRIPLGHLSVRVRDGHTQDALAFIDRTWHAFAPGTAIQRHFLDDDYDRQFQADERQGTLFGVFVGIAIFIACLGLFGLAAFSTERRTKEIGLRKTFGAGTRDIVWMLLRQFSDARADRQSHRLAGGLVLSARLAAGLCLSHPAQPALFPGRGRGRAGDRLGDGVRPCPPGGARQSHPCAAL